MLAPNFGKMGLLLLLNSHSGCCRNPNVGHDGRKYACSDIKIEAIEAWLQRGVHESIDEGPVHEACCEAKAPSLFKSNFTSFQTILDAFCQSYLTI